MKFTKRKYCPNCMRNVEGVKKLSGVYVLLTGGMSLLGKKYVCPICGCKTLDKPKTDDEVRKIRNG